MKIKINSMDLTTALKKAMLGTSKKSTPQAQDILLEATIDNKVILTSNSLKHGIQVAMDGAKVVTAGSIIIKESDFKLIQKLKNEITITSDENNNVIYKANRSLESKIDNTIEDFPKFPTDNLTEIFEIPALQFKDSCKIKKMAAKEETRPTLIGLAIQDGYVNAVDGYRIARIKLDIECEKEIIIPIETINLIEKIIDKKDASNLKFSLSEDGKILIIENDDYKIFTTLIDGEYLKVSKTIPVDKEISIEVDRKKLIESLEFVKIAIGKDAKKNPTKLYINKNDSELKVEATLKDKTINESIEIVNHDHMKEDFRIGFNFNYMLETLKMMEDDKIRIDFISSLSPMMLYSNDMLEQHMVLPMRIEEWQIEDKAKKSA